jgi:hypothetical protein
VLSLTFLAPITDMPFNVAVYSADGATLISDIYDDAAPQDKWLRGYRKDKFKLTRPVGETTIPLSQPVAVRAGETIRIKYWFETPVSVGGADGVVGASAKGKELQTRAVSEQGHTHTLAEVGASVLDPTTPDSGATVTDPDNFVHNDGGVMRQTSVRWLASYVFTKISGAISTMATSNATANRVLVSNASGKLAVSDTTSSELSMLRGGASDTNVTPVDSDKFILNDAGVIRQTNFARLFDYIVSKLGGAVSTVLTSNTTASRALASNASGKITVASTTSTELEQLSAGASDSNVIPVDTDKLIINDAGTMKQASFARLMDYVRGKMTSTQYINKGEASQANWVREWASIQCPINQWASKSLFIGGMEFVWSTQARDTGNLLMRTIDNTPSMPGTQLYKGHRIADPTLTNHEVWPHTWQNTGVTITAAYQQVDMLMMVRNTPALAGVVFRLTITSGGSSDLNMMCEYYGPKID